MRRGDSEQEGANTAHVQHSRKLLWTLDIVAGAAVLSLVFDEPDLISTVYMSIRPLPLPDADPLVQGGLAPGTNLGGAAAETSESKEKKMHAAPSIRGTEIGYR